jgi:catalase
MEARNRMQDGNGEQSKDKNLEPFRNDAGEYLTTNQGTRVSHTDDSLKAGERGPTLMEDFHFREKLTHFDHERIPERVVHARGSGAHGYFQVYEPMGEFTKAKFLQDPTVRTPVFVRFSTVVGFRGSADTVRDVRGFATKFYTQEGNFDLVGNNMPVFFIQDGIKFPDLVHAIKPEPHHEMPQASAAHDNFWDFASLTPESTHVLMWVLSDRALPRSYRMMQGFGVHTFRLVNEGGRSTFVKFHWLPKLGTHSLVWDEVQKLAGKDPDFNRRDLWEAIEMGDFPEWELGVQLIPEEDEHKFDFDLLDATKMVPEEEVPVRRIGKMVLNRNPDNFFAETEQVAFHIGNLVPGIDVTNDPLLQGRLFSYMDTQLIRLGGPNFHEIPINRPVAEMHNNQRDGYNRMTIDKGRANYFPNSWDGGKPVVAPAEQGGYVHYPQHVEGDKVRGRGEKFFDFFSQATLFWNSMSEAEKLHIVQAGHFELGKVERKDIRERVIYELFNNVDHEFARRVAMGVGVEPPASPGRENHGRRSAALSQENTVMDAPATRKVAVLLDDGFDYGEFAAIQEKLSNAGARAKVVSMMLGKVRSASGMEVEADFSHLTTSSIMFDAVYVPGGEHVNALREQGAALHFINEAFKHHKPIAATGSGVELLRASDIEGVRLAGADSDGRIEVDKGVISVAGTDLDEVARQFLEAIAHHRYWDREMKDKVPA